MNEALGRLLAQVEGGGGALVAGPSIAAGQLCADAAAATVGRAQVVLVASPHDELSLSGLIAQLSGQTDVGGQDDAVLELGFKRLTGSAPTLLLLLAPRGIGQSALRFLQHVARQAPQLGLIVSASPSVQALLAEPGFAALRARLQAAAPIEATAAPTPVSPEPVACRRPLVWAGAALGAAAILAGVAWFGHAATSAQQVGMMLPPSVPAVVPVPPLAPVPAPNFSAVSVPVLAKAIPLAAPRPAPEPRERVVARGAAGRSANEIRAAWVRRVWRERASRYYVVSPYSGPFFSFYP